MKIENITFFYAAMPEVTLAADGSQDALIVRIEAAGEVGWGECEASPLPSIAAFVTPRSHGVCQPVAASVIGAELRSPEDIYALHAIVRRNSMDLLQAAHVWSGVEVALWDLLGKIRQEPVWAMLGYRESLPKTAYASLLFGATPQDTADAAAAAVAAGFRAVKFGWGGFGESGLEHDVAQLEAARAGAGSAQLMIDAGQIFSGDVEQAGLRVPALVAADVTWLEEPFAPDEYWMYAELADRAPSIALAGGEAAHSPDMARTLIRYGKVRYVQIDTGRIGGIVPSKQVADFATENGVQYVNHTFTSHLSLAPALHSFAGNAASDLCEYPGALSSLAIAISDTTVPTDAAMQVRASDRPGIGVGANVEAIAPYLRTVEVSVDGQLLTEPTADGGVRVLAELFDEKREVNR